MKVNRYTACNAPSKVVIFNRPHLISASVERWIKKRYGQKYFGIGHLLPFIPANELEITTAITNLQKAGCVVYLENPGLFRLVQVCTSAVGI